MKLGKLIISISFVVLVTYSQNIDSIKTRLEIPQINEDDQIVSHLNYVLSYSENREQAEWVTCKLVFNKLDNSIERTDDFREDPKVLTGS